MKHLAALAISALLLSSSGCSQPASGSQGTAEQAAGQVSQQQHAELQERFDALVAELNQRPGGENYEAIKEEVERLKLGQDNDAAKLAIAKQHLKRMTADRDAWKKNASDTEQRLREKAEDSRYNSLLSTSMFMSVYAFPPRKIAKLAPPSDGWLWEIIHPEIGSPYLTVTNRDEKQPGMMIEFASGVTDTVHFFCKDDETLSIQLEETVFYIAKLSRIESGEIEQWIEECRNGARIAYYIEDGYKLEYEPHRGVVDIVVTHPAQSPIQIGQANDAQEK